jgi:hypothetical protein
MSTRIVRTQEELDRAIADKIDWIEIRSERGVWIEVTACDSSTVTAYGSSTVTACDSSTVRAYDSSTVRACDSSTVRAYGSSTVRACDSVAVHLHSATVSLTGGVVLDHTKIADFSPKEWCEYHGVTIEKGVATLYKAVNDKWTTDRGIDYSPGSKPSCDDWSDTPCCGGGLHFGPTPFHALAYHPEATKFISVGVRVSELRPITDGGTAKAKAPRVVRACAEVDIDGRPIGEAA